VPPVFGKFNDCHISTIDKITYQQVKFRTLFIQRSQKQSYDKQESRAVAGNPRDAAVIFDP